MKPAILALLAIPLGYALMRAAGYHFEWDGRLSVFECAVFCLAAYLFGYSRNRS